MLAHEGEFAAGLLEWVRGDLTPESEAAGLIVGETILMWRKVLEAKFKR